MFTAATRFGTRYAAPAAASGAGALLALSSYYSDGAQVKVKAEAAASTVVDINAVRKSISELIDDDAERRGDGTSLTGTFVRVSKIYRVVAVILKFLE